MRKNKATIAITGGAGRIGSAVAYDLIKQGYNVLLGDINKKELLKIKKIQILFFTNLCRRFNFWKKNR